MRVTENKSLELKVVELESKLNKTNNTFKKLNAGSKALEDMLNYQKVASDRTGLGYQGSTSKPQKATGKINFVKAKVVSPIPQKQAKVKFIPTCHHCGKIGHIRPNCFKLNRMHSSVNSYKLICHNCGIIGHIRPNCDKLKTRRVNVTPKSEKIVRPKIKTIWVRKSDLHAYDVEYDTLDDSVESRDFGLAL